MQIYETGLGGSGSSGDGLTLGRLLKIGLGVALILVIIVVALRWDPQAACDKVDHRLHHQFWCKKKVDPPFDKVVLTCDEIGEPFSGEGRALEGNKFVISAADVILSRHGGGARECESKNSTLRVRVLEFETELRGQEWLQEKSIKLKRVADTETSVFFDEELAYEIPNLHTSDVLRTYTYDNYPGGLDKSGKPYIEEGVYILVGRYGGSFALRQLSPPLSSSIQASLNRRTTYWIDRDLIAALYRSVNLTIPRLRLLESGGS